jgi:hypothetical protein
MHKKEDFWVSSSWDVEFPRKGFKHKAIVCLLLLCVFVMAAATSQVDLTANVKGILPVANGGTGSSVVGFTGPTAQRAFTLPDSNATLEYLAEKNVANGYAGLDASALLTASQLPTFSTIAKGAVPISPGGTTAFLRADGAFAVPPTSTVNFDWQVVPTGTINGVNAAFTTLHSCIASSVMLFSNGLLMTQGAGLDYTYSGSTITFVAGSIPKSAPLVYSCQY